MSAKGSNWLDGLLYGVRNIVDESTELPASDTIRFFGDGVTATYDSGNKRINIEIPGIAGSISWATVTGLALGATSPLVIGGSQYLGVAHVRTGSTPATSKGQLRATDGVIVAAKISGTDETVLQTAGSTIQIGDDFGPIIERPADASNWYVEDVDGVRLLASSTAVGVNRRLFLYGGAAKTATAKGHVGLDSTGRLTVYADGAEKTCLVTGDGGGGGSTSVGLYSARPAAGTAGRIYVPTDGPISFIDDGAAWRPMLPNGGLGTETSFASSWTDFGQGSPTLADDHGTLLLLSSSGNNNDRIQGFYKNAPVGAYSKTFCSCFGARASTDSSHHVICCFGWQESSSGKIVFAGNTVYNGNAGFGFSRWNSLTSYNGGCDFGADSPWVTQWLYGAAPFFVRIVDNGVDTLSVYTSHNGCIWALNGTEHYSSFLVSRPDRIFIGIMSYSSDRTGALWILSET